MSATLRDIREKVFGHSLRKAESITDIDRSLISRYERGQRRPDGRNLIRLAAYYGLSPEKVLEYIENARTSTNAKQGGE